MVGAKSLVIKLLNNRLKVWPTVLRHFISCGIGKTHSSIMSVPGSSTILAAQNLALAFVASVHTDCSSPGTGSP